ncbi:hypothetical protein D1AOALGA4SA_6446 [Olavius algarvensis Delta 1 endosymbiont]|nr:hypothetical protein D1AOALGA4SA_6446 [Olavius algarvensis Delta 1 endosymbiont]
MPPSSPLRGEPKPGPLGPDLYFIIEKRGGHEENELNLGL